MLCCCTWHILSIFLIDEHHCSVFPRHSAGAAVCSGVCRYPSVLMCTAPLSLGYAKLLYCAPSGISAGLCRPGSVLSISQKQQRALFCASPTTALKLTCSGVTAYETRYEMKHQNKQAITSQLVFICSTFNICLPFSPPFISLHLPKRKSSRLRPVLPVVLHTMRATSNKISTVMVTLQSGTSVMQSSCVQRAGVQLGWLW